MTTTEEHAAGPAAPVPIDPAEQRMALIRLISIVLGGAFLAWATGTTKTVLVVVAVIVMIMLHELGHFLTAKLAGMKVTEYFLGFGPRLWSIRKGETEYGIKAIPAGGYVRIIGMNNLDEVDPADEPRTYRQQPFWRRLSVAVAGSTVHFLLAFLLLWVLNAFIGVTPPDAKPQLAVGEITKLQDGNVSPAAAAGFEVGDKIVSVDGREFASWSELPRYIRSKPGETLEFAVLREGRELTLRPTTVDLSTIKGKDGKPVINEPTGFVGIGPSFPVEKTNPIAALGRAGGDLGEYTKITLKALGSLFSADGVRSYGDQLTGKPGAVEPSEDTPRLLSPVGFVRVADNLADDGLRAVLFLLVAINIFVGMFNMIPLPPLDGGHVAIAVYEKIRSLISGRTYMADVAKVMPVAYAVVLLVVFLGLSSLYLDLVRPLKLN